MSANTRSQVLNKTNNADSIQDIATLRRQSTTQLPPDDEQNSLTHSTRKNFTRSSTTSSTISKSTSTMLKRLSKTPSRYMEGELHSEEITQISSKKRNSSSLERSVTKKPSQIPTEQLAMAKNVSLSARGKGPKQLSLTKKVSSPGKHHSVNGPTRSSSVTKIRAIPLRNIKSKGKTVWYSTGAYLSVRSSDGKCVILNLLIGT